MQADTIDNTSGGGDAPGNRDEASGEATTKAYEDIRPISSLHEEGMGKLYQVSSLLVVVQHALDALPNQSGLDNWTRAHMEHLASTVSLAHYQIEELAEMVDDAHIKMLHFVTGKEA